MQLTQWSTRRLAAAVLGPVALWWGGVTWAVPTVIRAVHAGRLPFLKPLMSAAGHTPVEYYLARWEPFARSAMVMVLTAALVLLAGLVLMRQHRRRAAGQAEPDPGPASGWDLALVVAWAGLVTGLGEAYYLVLRAFYQRPAVPDFLNVSQHAVWMAPLANLAIFGAIGGLVVAVRSRAGVPGPRTVIAGALWLGLLTLIMTTGRLHWAAALALSAGIAARTVRIVSPGGGEAVRLARRSFGWLAAATVAMGATVPALEWLRERRQVASAGIPAPGVPNVLLIVLDTERAASTTLHGATRPTTPFLEQFARDGVLFDRAIAPSSWTLPSHAAMFTGRYTSDLRVDWHEPLDDTYPTLAEVLSDRGYATAGFVANQYYVGDLYGLDRGFGRWEDQPVLPGIVATHSWLARTLVLQLLPRLGIHAEPGRKTAEAVNAAFVRWLDRRPSRPFFAFLNYFDAHAPYLPPEPWNLKFSTTQPRYWLGDEVRADAYSPEDRAELLTAYEASIAYLDSQLEALFEALRQRDLLEGTLVVITSDHGEEFGEIGTLGHGHDLTMPLLHVPLVLVYPAEVPAGARVAAPVELRSLAATILDLAVGTVERVGGESLASYWGAGDGRPAGGAAYSQLQSKTSIVTESLHLIRGGDGTERLFDYVRDPWEQENLADDPRLAAVRDSLSTALRARLPDRPKAR